MVVLSKGSATEVLQAVPEVDQGDYENLMGSIERHYESGYRQEMFQMEQTNRYQKKNKSLGENATEIELLAHLGYAKEISDFVEKMNCKASLRVIHDLEAKRGAYLTPFVLTQDTATLLSKPVHKVQCVSQSVKFDGKVT